MVGDGEGGGPGDKKAVIRTEALCPPELVSCPGHDQFKYAQTHSIH